MVRSIIVNVFIVLLCYCSGCAYWYQHGKSFNDCERDLQLCYNEMRKYADMNVIGSYEVDFVKDCMKEKGYCLSTEDDLPKYVKRRDPKSESFWLLAGVAGTLD